MTLERTLMILTTVLAVIAVLTPPVLLFFVVLRNRAQKGHSLLRNYPILGTMRYFIEKLGPEFRFYITDDDNSGKPFSRIHFTSIVMAAKYCKTVIGFGSKRDFSKPGFYLVNSLFPKQVDEMKVNNQETFESHKYKVIKEGIFWRTQSEEMVEVRPWQLSDEDAIVIGPNRKYPYTTKAWFGCSAMSYGALGSHAHSAINLGLAMTGSGWHNTGEGGISPYHLLGADVISQIGSGKFGYRDKDGRFDEVIFAEKAAMDNVKAFELKMAQGAKIKGGHLEGTKVTPEIAKIRLVEPWKTINSPNRFEEFDDVDTLLDFISRLQEIGGKPVGIKVVIGNDNSLDEFAKRMYERGEGPDFITIDGGEGGSGATYHEMADSVGIPVYSSIVVADNALRKYNVRDRVKIFASGKLHAADQVCIALGLGADCINIARGFMIATGCIMTEKCHTGECPVGVATSNPHLEKALVIDEKKYRVANYVTTLRAGCYSLAASVGIDSPVRFNRSHVSIVDGQFKVHRADKLFT